MSFLSLNEYLLGAKKIMVAQKCGFLTKNDDAVADVAYRMMLADQTWNGTSSRDTWRYNQAKYAIMRIITKHKKKNKHKVLSLNHGWSDDNQQELIDRVPVTNHKSTYEEFEHMCHKAKNFLSDKQYHCIIRRYKDYMTLVEIGNEIGISKQCVAQHINNGIEILKKCSSKLN